MNTIPQPETPAAETINTNTTQDVQPTKSDYSFFGILVACLLIITIVTFVQFAVSDVTESMYGKKPDYTSIIRSENKTYMNSNTGEIYTSYKEAQDYYNQQISLPYDMKKLLVETTIIVPLFIASVLLLFSRNTMTSGYRLATNAFIISSIINAFKLITALASYAYTMNQKLTMYGVSFLLIAVFFGSIIFIQNRHQHTQ